jgi:HAD superfamily hydrolase (TIGR01509 family)
MMMAAAASSSSSKLFENIDALLFDCDGVLAETERDGHRVTFNKAFEAKGLKNNWSIEEYGVLLKTGGGKERMTKYFDQVGWPDFVPVSERASFVKELHKFKTNLFTVIVENGEVPLRPNIDKLIDEAFANGIQVGVCSTSNEVAVTAIVRKNLGEDRLKKMTIFAGDVVEKKKPAPDIYLLAAKTFNVEPKRCWVVEDSEIGMRAAKAAGMNCIVTKSNYTQHENFDIADVVVPDLTKGLDGPITLTYLNYKSSKAAYKPATVTANAELFASDKQNIAEMFNKIAKGEIGKGGMPF